MIEKKASGSGAFFDATDPALSAALEGVQDAAGLPSQAPAADTADTADTTTAADAMDTAQGRRLIQSIASRLGLRIVYDIQGDPAQVGEAYLLGDTIHMNPAASRPLFLIFKHELAHFAQRSRLYARFARAVMNSASFRDWLQSKGYDSPDAYIAQTVSRYQAALGTSVFGEYDASLEMLAEFVAETLYRGDTAGMTALLASLDAPARRSFIQWVQDFIQRIKERLQGSPAQRDIAILERRFSKLLRDAADNAERRDGRDYSVPVEELDADRVEAYRPSAAQEAYFAQSQVRRPDGSLLPVYHATEADFTLFDKALQGSATDAGVWGSGFYFDADWDAASDYGSLIDAYYLNLTNPYIVPSFDEDCSHTMQLFRDNGISIPFPTDTPFRIITSRHPKKRLGMTKTPGNRRLSLCLNQRRKPMKTIEYTLSSSGINPADVQAGGVQGDHCATALQFQITQDLWQYIEDDVPAGHNIRCHVETSDGTGGFHASDLLEMKTEATGTVTPDTTVRTVTYIIPKEITLAGGVAQFFLVISDVDNDSLSSHILFSFPARVRFDASAAGTNSADNYYGDINGALDVFLKAFPIGTDKIQDAAVTGDKIADGAVDTEHLANYAVTTDKLAPVSVTTTRLADGAVDSAKIADGAIITETIADGAVTPEKLASGYISTGYDGDLDDLKTPGMYKIVSNSSIDQHRPAGFDAMSLLVMDAGLLGGSQSYIQLAASGSGDDLYMRATAPGSGGAWSTWTNIRDVVDGAITTGKIADGAVTRDKLGEDIFWNYVTADFNTLTDYGLYVVRAGGNAPTADASTYALIVISDGNTVQLAIPNSANPQLYMRSLAAGNWSEWQPLGGGVADGSVTTAKLADEAVAWDKVSGDMLSPVKQLTVDFAGANRAIPLSILPYKYIEGNIYTLSLEARLTNANANSISLGPMLTADSGDRYNWDSNSYLSLSADWQSVTLSGIQGIQSIGLFVYGPSDAVPTPEVEIRNLQLCDTFDTDVIDHVAFQASGLRAMDIDSPTVDWPDNYLLPSLDYVKSLLHGVEKQIVPASTSQAGLVQLNNTLTSTSTTEALTAAQGKALSDKIDAIPGGGTVGDGSITTAKLANGAVTADKLADAAVPAASTSQAGLVQLNNTLTSTSTTQALTAAQGKALSDKIDAMPGGGTVGDGSITTAKLADGAVTAEKLADDAIPDASTTQAGLVQLNNSLTSTSTTQALTAAQGKALNDKVVKYGTCSTTASTAAKTATISGFSLVSGALVVVRFTYGNTASSPTLNISSTGAKSIYRDGSSSDSLDLASGEAVLLVYDGTYYRVVDIPDASTTRAGKVQLNNTLTSTSTTQALTAAQGKALNDKIPDIEVESGNCTLRTNTGSKTSACKYYKVGKMVTVYGSLPNYDGSSTYVSGLPFTPAEEASTITGTGTQATEYYILYAVTNGRLFMRDAAVHAFYIEDQWKGQSFTLTYITDE